VKSAFPVNEDGGVDRTNLFFGLARLLLGTAQTTSAAGSNETNLLAGRGIAANCRGLADVLMATTSVRMIHGVHGHTTDVRPAVALRLVLEERVAGLQDRLVNAAATGNDADCSTG